MEHLVSSEPGEGGTISLKLHDSTVDLTPAAAAKLAEQLHDALARHYGRAVCERIHGPRKLPSDEFATQACQPAAGN